MSTELNEQQGAQRNDLDSKPSKSLLGAIGSGLVSGVTLLATGAYRAYVEFHDYYLDSNVDQYGINNNRAEKYAQPANPNSPLLPSYEAEFNEKVTATNILLIGSGAILAASTAATLYLRNKLPKNNQEDSQENAAQHVVEMANYPLGVRELEDMAASPRAGIAQPLNNVPVYSAAVAQRQGLGM